jgi:predicted ester cyclase
MDSDRSRTIVASNKALVLAYYQRVVGEGRFEEIPKYIAESYVDHNAPEDAPKGPALVEMHLRGIRTTFPDFTLRTHEIIAEDDFVALRVTAEGTHLGEWLGIKPSGKRVALRGINLDRVSGGRIVEHWGEADTVGMLQQMGVDPFGSSK